MAKVIWEHSALIVLFDYVENARLEFGESTAKRWQKERKDAEWSLEHYPTSHTPEQLLRRKKKLYRGRHLMNRRFKLIYYYDETEDVVHIVDIWDTRMNPKALIRRIK
jgi:plasmid stabilization system protein ParE